VDRNPRWEDAFGLPVVAGKEWLQLPTKKLLQGEIEARSLKISAQRSRRVSGDTDNKGEEGDGAPQGSRPQLFVVCNKLPYTVIWHEESGTFECDVDPFEVNIASLFADGSCRSRNEMRPKVVLVGAPVVRRKSDSQLVPIAEGPLQQELDRYLRTEMQAVPVFPPPNRDRFADLVIFPLFHYSAPSLETGLGLYDWDGYELVSEFFRDAVLQEYKRGDVVWINDYPLMLLPKLLRAERPDICIGFYFHCVFPSSEVYRMLPQRESLLSGVLSSNVIGFHNFQYVRHFLTSCTRVLGLECTASGIEACEDAGGTCTKVIAVPLGLHLEPYQRILKQEDTEIRIRKIGETFANKRILLAVDRLEEKKGIPHKIMAFHKFLQKVPAWATECVFVMIVEATEEQPSKEESAPESANEEQQRLLQQIYQMVGEVNSKFGSIGHLPFHFLCHEFHRIDITALMVKAHVFVDTPLRDTLSRPAHEFLCCQEGFQPGVLILSEFSGSAQSLRASAICVNPWDTNGFADSIQEAMEMEYQDRLELHRYGIRYVNEYTLTHWARNFLDELQTAEQECETERLQIPPPLDHDKPVVAMRKSNRRLLILGFSGTLLPRKSKISQKILPKLPAVLQGNLQVIAEDPNTEVVVLSGLGREIMVKALGNIRCWIIAEGGVCYREPGSDVWHSSMEERELEWLTPVKEIMEYFAARTPGSTVIETSSSISWHYQKTQADHAAMQSKDLLIHLWAGPLLSAPAEVIVGNDSVSVRPTGAGKALQLEKVLQMICCKSQDGSTGGSSMPIAPEWLSGDAMVLCITDLIPRDEDVFVTVQKFFECEGNASPEQNGDSANEATAWDRPDWDGIVHSQSVPSPEAWARFRAEEINRGEEMHMATNSKSLGDVYNRLSMVSHSGLESDDGPFGLHRLGQHDPSWRLSEPLDDCAPLLKKSPSEPDLEVQQTAVEDEGSAQDEQQSWQGEEACGSGPQGQVCVYTCTVNRKATRALYHLSDTNDVAFLIAKLAREVRQAKQVPRFSPKSEPFEIPVPSDEEVGTS